MPAKRRRPVNQAEFRKWALALPEVTEQSHMGHPDFRVRNKIFATLPPEGTTVNLKSSRPSLDGLVRADPKTFRDVWGGRWLGVTLATVPREELRELLRDAWKLAAPVSLAKELTHERVTK